MTENGVHTRREDTPLYRWLPVVVIIASIGIAWGIARQQIDQIGAAVLASNVELRQLREQAIRREEQLARLNERLLEGKVATDLVAQLAESMGRLSGNIERNRIDTGRLWEIVRESQANIELVAEELRRQGGSVTLQRRRSAVP